MSDIDDDGIPESVSEQMRNAVRARWARMTAEERTAFAKNVWRKRVENARAAMDKHPPGTAMAEMDKAGVPVVGMRITTLPGARKDGSTKAIVFGRTLPQG